MLKITIPGFGDYELEHLLLDYNGTLAQDGELLPGVIERLHVLSKHLTIHIVTADTFNTVRNRFAGYPCHVHVLQNFGPHTPEDAAKLRVLEELSSKKCAFIGNGRNDRLALQEAAIGLTVIQGEGASSQALLHADVVLTDICDALDLLTQPKRLIATLRV